MLIAFGVVVLTTLGNTVLEWFRQSLSNRHASVTLRRALVEELRQAKETAELNIDRSGNPEPGGSFLIPVSEGHRIYDANIGNLGKLKPAEVSAVVRAYGMLQAQVETLAAIGTFHRTEGPVLHAIVDSKWGEILEANGRTLSEALGEAIDVLEGRKNPSDIKPIAKD